MVNRLFGSFREWALPARRRKESKSPSVDGVFAVQPACQETVSLWPGRDSSAAEIIRRTEPTGVEFVAEQRSAALSLAGSQTVDRAPVQPVSSSHKKETAMPTHHPDYVAIDIAKDSLQIQTEHAAWSVPHTATGHRQLDRKSVV